MHVVTSILLLLSLSPQPSLGLGLLHKIRLNFLEASQQFSFLQSRVVSPTPNLHPGGPGLLDMYNVRDMQHNVLVLFILTETHTKKVLLFAFIILDTFLTSLCFSFPESHHTNTFPFFYSTCSDSELFIFLEQ
jgi:hypothetical protein